MLNEIKLLTKIQICNFFGFNESKYSKDSSNRRKMYTAIIGILIFGIMICVQIGSTVSLLIELGQTDFIPSVIGSSVSGISFILTFFRAGPTLFSLKSYEKTVCLPVRIKSIVISRFLNLYIYNMFFNIAIVGSAIVVCLISAKLSVIFYLQMLIGFFVLPLLPMTLSVILGTVGYYLSSKLPKKNIFNIIWQIGLIAVILYFSSSSKEMNLESVEGQLISSMTSVEKYYPMLKWFSEGFKGNVLLYTLFVLVSLAVSLAILLFISKFYKGICIGLSATSAKRDYKIKDQASRSVFKALYVKEFKRYFASVTYVTNTIISFIFALALGIAVLVLGIDFICQEIGFPYWMLSRILPVVLGLICNVMPTTAASISLEGKNFWILQSLPINMRQIASAKIMLNLTFAIPSTIISSTCISIALNSNIIEIIFNFAIPIILVIFGSLVGLYMNIFNPMMEWDSDIVPVKQSKSALYTMFSLFLSGIAAMILFFMIPSNMLIIANVAILTAFGCGSILIFNKISKTDIKKIK